MNVVAAALLSAFGLFVGFAGDDTLVEGARNDSGLWSLTSVFVNDGAALHVKAACGFADEVALDHDARRVVPGFLGVIG